MKRKRTTKQDVSCKKLKSVHDKGATAAVHPVLSTYYSRVISLRAHLQEKIPSFNQAVDQLPLHHDVVALLDTVMVASDGLVTEPAIKKKIVAFTNMIKSRRPGSQMDDDLSCWSQKDASMSSLKSLLTQKDCQLRHLSASLTVGAARSSAVSWLCSFVAPNR
jgi:hypothetical protein